MMHASVLVVTLRPDAHPDGAEAPTSGVDISANELFRERMETNIDYLLTSFDVDHLLAPFRQRAGNASATWGSRAPAGFWDSDLLGSNAGRFLMGAGNTLRWLEHPKLRAMMDEVVDGVADCKNASGYILAYEPAGFMHSEQGDYGRSWFTQGLIEAGKAGNPKAFPLLRGMYDWFDDPDINPYQPYLYDGIGNGEQGQIASTRMYLETPVGVWSDMQVAQDIYRDNIWMNGLIARDSLSISKYHMPTPNHPHCYEITSFLSMFDHYRATGNSTWLHAAEGAWDIIHTNFLHIDGSSALTEGAPDQGTDWKKKTYRIQPGTGTGETCCTTFWIKFNQRFSLLNPNEEKYAAEIETAVYNALLKNIVKRPSTGEDTPYHEASSRQEISRGTPEQRNAAELSQLEADAASGATPPLCTKDCKMVTTEVDMYYLGKFHPDAAGATSATACSAACLKLKSCVAMTYSKRPADPCELYTSITPVKEESDGTVGAVKCAASGTKVATCGHFDPKVPPPPPGTGLPPGIRYHGVMEGLQERPQNVNTCCEGQGTRAFGSLPEYIWSVTPSDGLYINMFAASTLTYNATVTVGTGGTAAPAMAPPTPPPPGVVPGPKPALSWSMVAKDGVFPGDKHASAARVATLADCQALCEGSTGADDNQMCMGVAFKPQQGPPPPPPHKACTSNCVMVEVKNGYHTGAYNETQTKDIKDLASCKAACLKDEACVQLTFVNRSVDPCVLYQTIYADISTDATGWVKCDAGSTDPNKCAVISGHSPASSSNCELYQALDMSHQVMQKGGASKAPGTNTYMLHGRRVKVQHDYPTSAGAVSTMAAAAAAAAETPTGSKSMITPVRFAMATQFPYENDVNITVSWVETSATSVNATVNLRIPSWLNAPLTTITVNGQAVAASGRPGSYLKLDREWKQGDIIAIALPTVYKVTAYTGTDQIKGYEGKRFALSIGPIVLGCVGSTNWNTTTNAPVLPVTPTSAAAAEWLEPVEGKPLNFNIKGAEGLTFMPMWEMSSADHFTTFPIMDGRAG
jgi:DUF1680 family protein